MTIDRPSPDRRIEPIIIVPYSDEWPEQFQEHGSRIRRALGDAALRIDHIGSTSVPGLAAKPVIDIQISVTSFEPVEPIRNPLLRAGYVWRSDNQDLTKRHVRESTGSPRTQIHIRKIGSWSQQFALLFRDYIRVHPSAANQYAEVKRQLADQYRHDRVGYNVAKGPFIWETMRAADDWSRQVGWEPSPSDA